MVGRYERLSVTANTKERPLSVRSHVQISLKLRCYTEYMEFGETWIFFESIRDSNRFQLLVKEN